MTGSIDQASRRRAAAAARLAREHPLARIIVSGGGPPDAARPLGSEAEQMAELLNRQGVGRERIRIEDESLDTIGNAVLTSARFLRGEAPGTLLLVTSPFHIARARWAFARALPGWRIVPQPSEAGPEDDARAVTEPAYQAANEELLSGLADGDLAGMFERIAGRWPDYRRYARRVR